MDYVDEYPSELVLVPAYATMETDWRSIYILASTGFLMTFRVSAMGSALWPYMKLINPSMEESFLGAMSSLENFFNLSVSFLAGVLCNKLNDTKICTVLGVIFYICSVISYLSVELVPQFDKPLFMTMNICFGLAVGLTSVSRTHIAMASTEHDRPKAMSIYSLACSTGMGVGPILTILAALVAYPGLEYISGLHLNVFTIPPAIFLVITMISLVFLVCCYNGRLHLHPHHHNLVEPTLPRNRSRFSLNFETSYDKFAVFLCCLTRMVQSSSLLFLINVGGPYMMTAFGWDSQQLVVANAFLFTMIGVVGLLIGALYMTHIAQRYLSDRRAIVLAMGLVLLYYVITYPYPFYSSTIPYEVYENNTLVKGGCSQRFEWCATTPAVNGWLYFITMVLCMSIGIPLMMLNLDILYSKVLGNIKQGTMQGVFLVCGEFVNIVGPIILTAVYEATGPIYLWQFNIVTVGAILAVWVKYYPRMISATRRIEEKSRSAPNLEESSSSMEKM
ncbi:unnamed protein product [Bursaphelenchus xylophilus]|uniref:(pine wood nematode) hypothetical protein n=1 Tax=Bursaphelenchus xylophilus TaxID=6326 RepID=A0A1I7RM08_BURXY|nr:unnamed protein product [Bursaphelenchus xylophilus]CAG9118087.1 unnamed protein product [Bursaphelenchus xylophilus]